MVTTTDGKDIAGSLAIFLLDKTGSIFGKWTGRLGAKEQRALFGQFLGRGLLVIDGSNETIKHVVRVCFGQDTNTTASGTWRELCNGVDLKTASAPGTAAELAARPARYP
jgi:hypothetical protein